jgi:hypothetical protein
MATSAKQIKEFQVDFLRFLSEKKVAEVHIYHHVMNYWSNDSSTISLQTLKDAITDLADRKLIISKNNSHNSIGIQGISEDDQKNNAVCIIQEAGLQYLKKADLARKAKNIILIILIFTALFLLWYNRKMIEYFFK